ncbi:MAG: addiction module protein [Nostoc sp.]|uniref:addiction module protein n=1 Tax=Nostoc sp. TaxID=1180 RepID=UPI002FF92CF8
MSTTGYIYATYTTDNRFIFQVFCKAIALLGIKADVTFDLIDKILSAIFKVYQLLPHSKLISMNITATLNEIATLSVEDRILIVQGIWDSIAAEQVYPDLTDAQKQELDRRTADYDSNPDNVLTWEEIKASIKGQQ